MAWRLNRFLCCFKLETGGRVIGGFQLIVYIVAFILAILGIVGGTAIINDPKTSPKDVAAMKSGYLSCLCYSKILI